MNHNSSLTMQQPLYAESSSLDLGLTSPLNSHELLRRKLTDAANTKIAATVLRGKMDSSCSWFLTSLLDRHVHAYYEGHPDDDVDTTMAVVGHNDMAHEDFVWGNIRCVRPRTLAVFVPNAARGLDWQLY